MSTAAPTAAPTDRCAVGVNGGLDQFHLANGVLALSCLTIILLWASILRRLGYESVQRFLYFPPLAYIGLTFVTWALNVSLFVVYAVNFDINQHLECPTTQRALVSFCVMWGMFLVTCVAACTWWPCGADTWDYDNLKANEQWDEEQAARRRPLTDAELRTIEETQKLEREGYAKVMGSRRNARKHGRAVSNRPIYARQPSDY